VLSGALALSLTSAQAVTMIDLRTEMFNDIGGAIYQFDTTHPSGTGVFGADSGGVFSSIQGPANGGSEEGYNTSASGIMDNKRVPKWNHEVLVSDLVTVSREGVNYVPFLLDINEPNAETKWLITLDDVKILTSPNELVETTLSGLLGAGTLRYDMDAIADSFVLLDYSRIGGGSGTSDMTLLVLASLFDSAADTDYVYLYSHFGSDDASSLVDDANTLAHSGFEEWTLGDGARDVPDDPGPDTNIPEPSTGMLGAIGLMLILRRRNK